MDIIALDGLVQQDISLLNEQITFHEKRSVAVQNEPWRTKIHQHTANSLRVINTHMLDMLSTIKEQETTIQSLQKELDGVQHQPKSLKTSHQINLTFDDIQDLPDELIKELSINKDDLDFIISNLIAEAGGILSLDKILVGLYKKTGEIHKRTAINNRLYRMGTRGELFSVPGKKGVYSTEQLTIEQMNQMFGPSKPENPEEGSDFI